MKQWLIACLAVTVLPAWAAGDAQRGAQKAGSCMACHGAAGKAAVPLYPDLAGQHAPYLEHALKAFVAGLSDSDMADLAAYYSSLQP
jgi:cytochrome c553